MSRNGEKPVDDSDERVGFVFDCDFFLRGTFQVPGYVILDPDLSDPACRTLMVVMQHAWKDGECYPGLERLAQMRGKSRRSIISHIHELVALGHLQKHKRGQGKTNIYVINTQRQVVISRSEENVTSGGEENVTQSLSSLILTPPGAADGVGAEGERPPGAGDKPGKRISRVLGIFRDKYRDEKRQNYMVKNPADRVLVANLIKTYSDDDLRDLISVYFSKPYRTYTIAGFYRAVPELIEDLDAIQTEMAQENRRRTEFELLAKMIEGWDRIMADRSERIQGLEQQIDQTARQQRIPDEAARRQLRELNSELDAVYHSALRTLCETLHIPNAIKVELNRLLRTEYPRTREALIKMQSLRVRKGGD